MTGNLVEVRGLQVDFLTAKGLFTAVKSVDFNIGHGEVLGLAGESGSGKSTIAFSLMRLHRPPALISKGSIIIDGEDVLAMPLDKLSKWRWSKVSMVFQSAMISCRISRCTTTSSAVVGSSMMISLGSSASDMASTIRWRMPPESWCG